MRRFGLRLGLLLNPAVVAAVLAVMAVVVAAPGAASYGLFALAGVLRIADIATTDGTTRTSINAAYQIVPVEERLAVQAVVEGIGVPVAIGVTGVLLLRLEPARPRDRRGDRLRSRAGPDLDGDRGRRVPVVHTRARRRDAPSLARRGPHRHRRGRRSRSRASSVRRRTRRAPRPRPARRRRRRRQPAPSSARSRGTRIPRYACAHSVSSPRPETREAAADRCRARRRACSIRPTPAIAARLQPPSASRGVVGADRGLLTRAPRRPRSDCASRGARCRRPRRCGRRGDRPSGRRLRRRAPHSPAARPRHSGASADSAVPLLGAALARDGRISGGAACTSSRGRRAGARRGRHRTGARATPTAPSCSRRSTRWRRRGARDVVPAELLDGMFRDAAAHAARALAARASLAGQDGPLDRALDDEIDLARRLVIAVLALRHGDRVRAAVRVVDHAEGQRRALGVEALDVLLSREEAAIALPLVRRDLTPGEQAASSSQSDHRHAARRSGSRTSPLDPDRVWRSSWLAACARHASRS